MPTKNAGKQKTKRPSSWRILVLLILATLISLPATELGKKVASAVLPRGNHPAPVPESSIHVVQTGETMLDIARRYGITVRALMDLNGIGPGDRLRAGQRLTVSTASGPPRGRQRDADIEFIRKICMRTMAPETSVPVNERQRFCACATDKVSRQITEPQRATIREAQRAIGAGESFDPTIFEKTGLKALVAGSQDACIESLWPIPPTLSEAQHRDYSTRANRSVNEYSALLDTQCANHPKSERPKCLLKAAKDWLANHGKAYEDIPEPYITGNNLAKDFVEKL